MLLEFGLKNFFSFKEGAEISFKLDKNCPDIISHGKTFSTALGIKGANASGKTHILRGLSFISRFCTDSFSASPESPLMFEPFFGSKEPTEFFAEFQIDNYIYLYELVAFDFEILRETIYRTKTKKIKIIERIGNNLEHCTNEFASFKSIKLRKNASIISTAHQYELNELNHVYMFFNYIISNVSYSGAREEPRDINTIASILNKNKKWFNFTKEIIKKCDLGISDITISEKSVEGREVEYYPMFVHEIENQPHFISSMLESSGTKTLFRELMYIKWMLERGGILVIDEFGTNLHPHILPLLLDYFLDPTINVNNAQFIFTTHDDNIINVLGRYRTYLVNKKDNESFAYRLDEIPGDILRNDRPISPTYNDGKIGGVPIL